METFPSLKLYSEYSEHPFEIITVIQRIEKFMSVIELQTSYDITGPHNTPDTSLCSSCKIKGKSFLCLVIKRTQYPLVDHCNEYVPSNK